MMWMNSLIYNINIASALANCCVVGNSDAIFIIVLRLTVRKY